MKVEVITKDLVVKDLRDEATPDQAATLRRLQRDTIQQWLNFLREIRADIEAQFTQAKTDVRWARSREGRKWKARAQWVKRRAEERAREARGLLKETGRQRHEEKQAELTRMQTLLIEAAEYVPKNNIEWHDTFKWYFANKEKPK